MCDKLVFDLSQEVEGSPNVFVRKDWVNILDNQNQNYSNSQSIIDTSQLSNSNKYMSYRESYLAMPLLMTMALPTGNLSIVNSALAANAGYADISIGNWNTSTTGTSADYVMGLKNWFGTMIHSLTLDYNGSTICQQTPFINMWNTFKLMTSLSYQDVLSQGAQIGFFPDDSASFQFFPAKQGGDALVVGGTIVQPTIANDSLLQGTCNNTNLIVPTSVSQRFNSFSSGAGNTGFLERQQNINFDATSNLCSNDINFNTGATSAQYGDLLYNSGSPVTPANPTMTGLWKSYIFNKINGVVAVTAAIAGAAVPVAITTPPVLQINVMATIKLKHVHSFFNMCPLLKGVFMKITLNLNNTSTSVVCVSNVPTAGTTAIPLVTNMHVSSVSNALGGTNPLMVASPAGISTATTQVAYTAATSTSQSFNGGYGLFANNYVLSTAGGSEIKATYLMNVSVGNRCLDQALVNTPGVTTGLLAQSVYLYIPAYTFNPPFEQAILSSPIKQINYTDVYQYQITNIGAGQFINQLITNGIANIKSILILPFYSATASGTDPTCSKSGVQNSTNTGFLKGYPVFQSPYDPAGSGTTSPLCHISNFNVQISGQNAIYNLQKYNFEQFNNQLYGQNAVNGGLTDGLTSGLVGRNEFDMSHCYYYVNVERMLPVEMGVPKSVQVVGQNMSAKACDYYVFIEYGVKISIDILTGARV
jgi:hypothetical protein